MVSGAQLLDLFSPLVGLKTAVLMGKLFTILLGYACKVCACVVLIPSIIENKRRQQKCVNILLIDFRCFSKLTDNLLKFKM